MNQPLISILTPFKNVESYLAACLDSIVAQSYTNWELLLVNDHSTDSSNEIAEAYAMRDKRIHLSQNTSTGIITALRQGFANSKGELITRMDSDDIMHEDKLLHMSSDLIANGKGHVALGLVQYFSQEGISDGYERYEKWLNRLTSDGSNYSEIYKECVIASPCWMMHREDLIACEAFEPDRYPEDYDLTFRFYKYGMKCLQSNKLLHYWRDYSTRTSRTHEHYAQNYFLDIKLHYFLELDYDASRPLVIWGAGFKGKTIAKTLVDKGIAFYWICDNPKKIGKSIYGQEMLPFKYLKSLKNPQSIITVANEEAQKEIRQFMSTMQAIAMKDYFFFC